LSRAAACCVENLWVRIVMFDTPVSFSGLDFESDLGSASGVVAE
jgi:hypothetical protein